MGAEHFFYVHRVMGDGTTLSTYKQSSLASAKGFIKKSKRSDRMKYIYEIYENLTGPNGYYRLYKESK